MPLGTLEATLLGNLLAGKGIAQEMEINLVQEIKKKNELQELVMETKLIFNASSSFKKLWNTKVLLKWIKI